MIKRLALAILAVVFLGGLLNTTEVQAQADDWSPVSSVGMTTINDQRYFITTAGYRDGNQTCFGTWGRNNASTLGGTRVCAGDGATVGPTAFDNPPIEDPWGEQITAGVTFSNAPIYSVAHYNLDAAGVNAATQIYSIYGTARGLVPFVLTNVAQSDVKQHRVQTMVVFNNNLYFGTRSQVVGGSSFGAQIWRHDEYTLGELGANQSQWAAANSRWQKVVNNGFTSTNNEGVMHMFVYNNQLYAALYNVGLPAKLLRSSNGTTWVTLANNFGSNGEYVSASTVFNGRIYIGLSGGGAYSSPDGVNWINHSAQLAQAGRAMAMANGILYVGGGNTIYCSSSTTESTSPCSSTGSNFKVSTTAISNVETMVNGSLNRLYVGTGVNPTDYQSSPRQARIWCLGCTTPPVETGTLVINLPPNKVYRPDKFVIEGNVYTFDDITGEFTGPPTYNVTTELVNEGETYESYKISVGPIVRGEAAFLPGMEKLTAFERLVGQWSARAYAPPPANNALLLLIPVYDFKMTFDRIATRQTINGLASSINGLNLEFTALTDNNCANQINFTHICFKPKVTLSNFSGSVTDSLFLQEAVRLDQPGLVEVHGNTLAGFQVGGFVFPSQSKWVAVGGTFTAGFGQNNPDNEKLENYVTNNAQLQWGSGSGSIANKLDIQKTAGIKKAVVIPPDNGTQTTTINNSLNLYARGTNPSEPGSSSFTTQPGGKIWYNGNANSNVTLNNVTVRGAGTLIVRGNLVVNGALGCDSNTSFGVIATGNITFNNPEIGCGAYVALGQNGAAGDITIGGNVANTNSATGIFIAKTNIVLPSVSEGGKYTMFYDATFALDPSALFSEILDIIFTTTS